MRASFFANYIAIFLHHRRRVALMSGHVGCVKRTNHNGQRCVSRTLHDADYSELSLVKLSWVVIGNTP